MIWWLLVVQLLFLVKLLFHLNLQHSARHPNTFHCRSPGAKHSNPVFGRTAAGDCSKYQRVSWNFLKLLLNLTNLVQSRCYLAVLGTNLNNCGSPQGRGWRKRCISSPGGHHLPSISLFWTSPPLCWLPEVADKPKGSGPFRSSNYRRPEPHILQSNWPQLCVGILSVEGPSSDST